MSHSHDALYRAICACPDEDTPRLAYADLLEDEGEPGPAFHPGSAIARAAFIRAQVAVARVDEYDPLHVSTRQLRPDVFTGWGMAHTLPRVPGGFGWNKFEFRRGFPWKVGVLSLEAFVGDGAGVFDAAPIQALEVDDRHRPDTVGLAEWPSLGRIRRLEFSLGLFGAEALARLGNSPYASELTELSFDIDGLTADGLEALTRSRVFAQLESLELRSCVSIPASELIYALSAAREPGRLSRLSLPANRLRSRDAGELLSLPAVSQLQALDLSDNGDLGSKCLRAFAASSLRGLRLLNLRNTTTGANGVRDAVATGALEGIRSLDLSANRLGPAALKHMAEAASLRQLRILNLANNPIQDAGAEVLAKAPALSGLLELTLGDAGLTDAGALALAESPYLGGLLRLDLTCREVQQPFSGKVRRALVERFGQRISC